MAGGLATCATGVIKHSGPKGTGASVPIRPTLGLSDCLGDGTTKHGIVSLTVQVLLFSNHRADNSGLKIRLERTNSRSAMPLIY